VNFYIAKCLLLNFFFRAIVVLDTVNVSSVAKLDEMLTGEPLNYTKHIDPSSGVVFYIHTK
jgi:hypothetical protein